MPWHTETETDSDGVRRITAWNDTDPKSRFLTYEIDRDHQKITFYPRDDFQVRSISITGYRSVPEFLHQNGYFKSGLGYFLQTRLSGIPLESIEISRTHESSMRKVRNQNSYRVVFGGQDLDDLRTGLSRISTEAQAERGAFVNEHLKRLFPARFESLSTDSASRRARRVMRNLDPQIIDSLQSEDVTRLVDFMAELLDRRYTAAASRLSLFRAAKIRVDDTTL